LRTYQAIFILDNKKIEDGGNAFSAEIEAQIEKLGGKVLKKESLGRKQFARMIKKQKAGTYWNIIFDLSPDQVFTFTDSFKLNETVIRVAAFLYEAPPVAEKKEADSVAD
jgi:ribosomal protein S6